MCALLKRHSKLTLLMGDFESNRWLGFTPPLPSEAYSHPQTASYNVWTHHVRLLESLSQIEAQCR
jgi:hypothetical protein